VRVAARLLVFARDRQDPFWYGPNGWRHSPDWNNLSLYIIGRVESAREEKWTHNWADAQLDFRVERN
jgi:hypothetical protein